MFLQGDVQLLQGPDRVLQTRPGGAAGTLLRLHQCRTTTGSELCFLNKIKCDAPTRDERAAEAAFEAHLLLKRPLDPDRIRPGTVDSVSWWRWL